MKTKSGDRADREALNLISVDLGQPQRHDGTADVHHKPGH
jgi:hypothetical protein